MSWTKVSISKVLSNAPALDKNKLIVLAKMMADEITDNLETIEAFTKAYSVLKDVVDKNDNYVSIRDLFKRAAKLASDYPDSAWMLEPKAVGKMKKDCITMMPMEDVRKLSEELRDIMSPDGRAG